VGSQANRVTSSAYCQLDTCVPSGMAGPRWGQCTAVYRCRPSRKRPKRVGLKGQPCLNSVNEEYTVNRYSVHIQCRDIYSVAVFLSWGRWRTANNCAKNALKPGIIPFVQITLRERSCTVLVMLTIYGQHKNMREYFQSLRTVPCVPPVRLGLDLPCPPSIPYLPFNIFIDQDGQRGSCIYPRLLWGLLGRLPVGLS